MTGKVSKKQKKLLLSVFCLVLLVDFLIKLLLNLSQENSLIYSDSHESMLSAHFFLNTLNFDGIMGEYGDYFHPFFYSRIGHAVFTVPFLFFLDFSSAALISGVFFSSFFVASVFLLSTKYIKNTGMSVFLAFLVSLSPAVLLWDHFYISNFLGGAFFLLFLYFFYEDSCFGHKEGIKDADQKNTITAQEVKKSVLPLIFLTLASIVRFEFLFLGIFFVLIYKNYIHTLFYFITVILGYLIIFLYFSLSPQEYLSSFLDHFTNIKQYAPLLFSAVLLVSRFLFDIGFLKGFIFYSILFLSPVLAFLGSIGIEVSNSTNTSRLLDFEFFEYFWLGIALALLILAVGIYKKDIWLLGLLSMVIYAYSFYQWIDGTESRYAVILVFFIMAGFFVSMQKLFSFPRYTVTHELSSSLSLSLKGSNRNMGSNGTLVSRVSFLRDALVIAFPVFFVLNIYTTPATSLSKQDITLDILNQPSLFECIPENSLVYVSYPETVFLESQKRSMNWSTRKMGTEYPTFTPPQVFKEDLQVEKYYLFDKSMGTELEEFKGETNSREVCEFSLNSIYRLSTETILIDKVIVLKEE